LYPIERVPGCGVDWVKIRGGASFAKNGTCTGGCDYANGMSVARFTIPVKSHLYNLTGYWKFVDSQRAIQITNYDGHVAYWSILQLDRDKLKIISDSVEFVMVRAD
jgi:hypothetical protein